jgi:hypothetical protein
MNSNLRDMIKTKQSKGWNYLEAKTAVVTDMVGLEPRSVLNVQRPKPLHIVNINNCLPKNIQQARKIDLD